MSNSLFIIHYSLWRTYIQMKAQAFVCALLHLTELNHRRYKYLSNRVNNLL